jgi:monoamine oxidase
MPSRQVARIWSSGNAETSITMDTKSGQTPESETFDCLIIGAGAAGLATARQLKETRPELSVAILEARNRLGGRTWTDTSNPDLPLELGGEFIHGRNAETHRLLKEAGMEALPAERYERLKWASPDGLLPISELKEPLKSTWKRIKKTQLGLADDEPAIDTSLAAHLALQLGEDWNPELENMADVLLAQTCCAPVSDLSCADLSREMRADKAGNGEYRLKFGYSKLWDWYTHGLDVRLEHAVLEIYWSGPVVEVRTAKGLYKARTVVSTVPVSVLAKGTPKFIPDLPRDKMDAIAGIKTMSATKLIYTFKERFWDICESYVCGGETAARWWFPSEHRGPAAPAIACCFLTANRAAVVDALSEEEARDLGLKNLANIFSRPPAELFANLVSFHRVSWIKDPWALGGYAYIPVGSAGARETLAESVGGRLFFAGEATAFNGNPQTVHGALGSGWRAGKDVVEVLGY